MDITLHISPSKYIFELQHEFNHVFPFLRLECYRLSRIEAPDEPGHPVTKTSLLRAAGVRESGTVSINGRTTVREFEALLKEKFGLITRVLRRAGNVWLETTLTDDWALTSQNDHGRELSNDVFIQKAPESSGGDLY